MSGVSPTSSRLGRQIGELERNPQCALDDLFTRHKADQRREDDRQNLQSEVPEAGKCHSGKRARGFGAEQPRAAAPDDEAQLSSEHLGRNSPFDFAVTDQRYAAGFLRDHDSDGVVLFGEAERRTVACSLASSRGFTESGRKHAAAAMRSP